MTQPESNNFKELMLPVEVADQHEVSGAEVVQTTLEENNIEQKRATMRSWVAEHRGWLIGAGFVASAALSVMPSAAAETVDGLKEVTPWAVPGMAVAEGAWIGGAAVVVASAGKKNLGEAVRHPLKTKSQFTEIARAASSSTKFKTGFVINTAGAVAEFIIPAVAVTSHLPAESWGVLTPFAADLAITIATRKAILSAVRENRGLDSADCS